MERVQLSAAGMFLVGRELVPSVSNISIPKTYYEVTMSYIF